MSGGRVPPVEKSGGRRSAASPPHYTPVLYTVTVGVETRVVLFLCVCVVELMSLFDFAAATRRTSDRPAWNTHTHTPFSETNRVSRYQKGKTNLDFTEARDSEWQWHQQVCTSLQTDIHASTPPLSFYRPDALPAA